MANPSVLHDDGIKTGTVASTSIQPTTAPTAGNYAVLNVTQSGASSAETITDTGSNTWTKKSSAATSNDNVASQWTALLSSVAGSPYKVNLAGMATVATPWGVNFQEVINFDPSTPVDGTPAATNYANAASTTISIGVGTASVTGDLGIAVTAANSAETWTPTAPLTTRSSSNTLASPMAVMAGTETSTGSITLAGSYNVSSRRATAGLLIKAPASNTFNLVGQAVTSTEGTVSPAVSYSVSGQAITSTLGTLTPSVSYATTGQPITSVLGAIVPTIAYGLTGQTVVLTEGTITASTGGDVTLTLAGQVIASTLGTLAPSVSYSALGQTLSTAEGAVSAQASYPLNGQNLTLTEGTIGSEVDLALQGQSVTSAEGLISANIAGDVTVQLNGLSAVFALGQIVLGAQSAAGKHRRHFGVRDGDRLLIFDTRAEANAAAQAIALRDAPKPRNKRKVKVRPIPTPAEVVPLPVVARAAESAGATESYQELLRIQAYTLLAQRYEAWIKKVAQDREEEEIAMILLHL